MHGTLTHNHNDQNSSNNPQNHWDFDRRVCFVVGDDAHTLNILASQLDLHSFDKIAHSSDIDHDNKTDPLNNDSRIVCHAMNAGEYSCNVFDTQDHNQITIKHRQS
jgi:hypothetical protein